MRRQSSGLVTAADKNSDIGVLFDVDFDFIVRKGCFQQGSTLNFSKKLQNFFCFNFKATPWSNNISSTNGTERTEIFFFVCLLLLDWPFFCMFWRPVFLYTCRCVFQTMTKYTRLQNKQQKYSVNMCKNGFPATPGPVSDWFKLKLSLHDIALKSGKKSS